MSSMLPDKTLVGKATQGMWLVFNCTPTPKKVTVDGRSLGGKEKAWVTKDDPVLLAAIESGTIRLVWDGTVSDVRQDEKPVEAPSPTNPTRKRKPKKSTSGE